MTTESKIRANRNNARASTGPKTPEGKARVARNAMRHGLDVPVSSNLLLSAKIEDLAREITNSCASPEIQELARRAAEAQVDLNRVRDARHQVLSQAFANAESLCYPDDPGAAGRRPPRTPPRAPADRMPRPKSTSKGLNDLGPSKALVAFDRYERRALSRLKFAIRALGRALGVPQ